MKKILILSAITLLCSGIGFAQQDKGGDKGKDKAKKTHTSGTKSCPGKECGKKKG